MKQTQTIDEEETKKRGRLSSAERPAESPSANDPRSQRQQKKNYDNTVETQAGLQTFPDATDRYDLGRGRPNARSDQTKEIKRSRRLAGSR